MKQQTEVMDERQRQINIRAMANGFVFLLLCLIISMFYKLFTTDDPGWEMWAMLGSCLVLVISRRVLGDVEQPKDIFDKPLPTGSTREDKAARKKNYVLQSVIFAVVCAVMDVLFISTAENENVDYELTQLLFPDLSRGAAIAVTAVISFVVMFLVSYLFEFLVGEFYTLRRYNKMIAEFDAEDE